MLWISEVLHASPGPKIGEILPYSFLLGNIVAIWTTQTFGAVGRMANGLALAAYFAFVGSGLSGPGDLGAYNLALNDGIKGCPTYEQVRQPSMDDFDVTQYQGRW